MSADEWGECLKNELCTLSGIHLGLKMHNDTLLECIMVYFQWPVFLLLNYFLKDKSNIITSNFRKAKIDLKSFLLYYKHSSFYRPLWGIWFSYYYAILYPVLFFLMKYIFLLMLHILHFNLKFQWLHGIPSRCTNIDLTGVYRVKRLDFC